MARLPVPGSDDGSWGEILNTFLGVEHNPDGTLKLSGSAVQKEGDQTIGGVKTFSSSPLVPTPTTSTAAANKAYVDSTVSAGAADATTTTKGIVQLAGDFGGTATSPTVPGLAGKIDKSTVAAKGDLLAATGSAVVTRHGAGTNGQVAMYD